MNLRQYPADRIRNVGLFAHGGAGKTSLAEALLFDTKATTRLGRVDEGNTVTDYDPDEIKRRISVSAALAPVEWRDTKINVIDAPGYADFIGDVKSALRVADAAIIVIDASAGVEVGTEQAWRLAEERGIPRLLFINKMDRENADFGRALASARAAFGNAVAPIQFPIGAEKQFRGVVDLLTEQAHCYTDNTSGEFTSGPIPDELKEDEETLPPSARRIDRRAGRRADDALSRGRADLDRGARRRAQAVRRRRRGRPGAGRVGDAEPRHPRSSSTPSSTICHRRPRRERPARSMASEVEVAPDRRRSDRRPRLQDAGRSARRTRHLPARLLRDRSSQTPTPGTRRAARTSGSASSSSRAAKSTSTPTPSAPATSARWPSWPR